MDYISPQLWNITNDSRICGDTFLGDAEPWPISDTREWLYYLLTGLTSALSICGSIFLIRTCWKLANRSHARQMLVYLSFCDLLIATSNLTSTIWATVVTDFFTTKEHVTNDVVCKIQAGLTSLGSMASFFWTTMMAINIYLNLIHNNKILSNRFHLLPHLLSWGVPAIVATIAWSANRYGLNACTEKILWCWVAPHNDDIEMQIVQWQLVTGKLWEISSYIIVAILYSITKFKTSGHIKRLQRSRTPSSASSGRSAYSKSTEDTFKAANRKLIFVPLVFIIARIWGTLRFLLDLSPLYQAKLVAGWLAPLQGIGDSCQGIANSLVFIYTTPSERAKLLCRQVKCHHDDKSALLTREYESSEIDTRASNYGSFSGGNPSTTSKFTNSAKNITEDPD